MPQPSPILGSAPTAPRWSRLCRMDRPCSTMSWDLRFFMSAMKPTPQESCSLDGSYSPCGAGSADSRTGLPLSVWAAVRFGSWVSRLWWGAFLMADPYTQTGLQVFLGRFWGPPDEAIAGAPAASWVCRGLGPAGEP